MEDTANKRRWTAEPMLGGLALILLLAGCIFVLHPFMTALMWAIILTYSLYPMQRMFTRWFRGSRTLAACFVTLTVTILLAGPVVLIGMSIVKDGQDLAKATRDWFMTVPDQPPKWVRQAPVVGDEFGKYWMEAAEGRKRWMDQLDKEVKTPPPRPKIVVETSEGGLVVQEPAPPAPEVKVEPDADEDPEKDVSSHLVVMLGRFLSWAQSWLISAGKALVGGVTQVLVSAFLAFFLLRDAPELSERLAVTVERLAGDRGRYLIKVAGDTVRGVIYGILGTAIVQALVAGLGFWIAGVPGAVLLAVLTFFFAVVPFGPPLIWLPASLWLFAQDKPGVGLFMLLWGLLGISSVDNILRPYLISQGSKMPFVLIFCGVIGGALAFGLVGVFLGPTLLAVAFRLVEEWSSQNSRRESDSRPEVISALPAAKDSETPAHGGESLGVG